MRKRLRLEHGLLLGSAITLAGLVLIAIILLNWIGHGLGSLAQEQKAILAATLLVLGIQTTFTSFLLSILGLRKNTHLKPQQTTTHTERPQHTARARRGLPQHPNQYAAKKHHIFRQSSTPLTLTQ
jgi:hypothetical protein